MEESTKIFVNDKEIVSYCNEFVKLEDQTNPVIDQNQLESIGLIIVNFQELENKIKIFIEHMAEISNIVNQNGIFTLFLPFKKCCHILKALLVEKDYFRKDEITILTNKAMKAEEIRNNIVHSIWLPGSRVKAKIKKNDTFVHMIEEFTNNELLSIARQYKNLSSLFEFFDDELCQISSYAYDEYD